MFPKCLKCTDAKRNEGDWRILLKCNMKGTFSIHEISVFVALKRKVVCLVSAWNILVLHATVYINHNRFWIVNESVPCFTQMLYHILEFKYELCTRNHDTVEIFHCCYFAFISFILQLAADLLGWYSKLNLLNIFTSRNYVVLRLYCSIGCRQCFYFESVCSRFPPDHSTISTLWWLLWTCVKCHQSSSVCFFYLDFWEYCTFSPNRCNYFLLCRSTTALWLLCLTTLSLSSETTWGSEKSIPSLCK